VPCTLRHNFIHGFTQRERQRGRERDPVTGKYDEVVNIRVRQTLGVCVGGEVEEGHSRASPPRRNKQYSSR